MKNAKAENKKKFSGKIAGLTVLEALFYILSLPVIVVLSERQFFIRLFSRRSCG